MSTWKIGFGTSWSKLQCFRMVSFMWNGGTRYNFSKFQFHCNYFSSSKQAKFFSWIWIQDNLFYIFWSWNTDGCFWSVLFRWIKGSLSRFKGIKLWWVNYWTMFFSDLRWSHTIQSKFLHLEQDPSRFQFWILADSSDLDSRPAEISRRIWNYKCYFYIIGNWYLILY